MKYLLLVTDSNSNNIKNIKLTDNFKIINVYKNQNPSLIIKIIRKVLYFSSFKMNNLFYDNWVQYLKDNEYRFIVFDDCKPFFRLAKFLKTDLSIAVTIAASTPCPLISDIINKILF